MAGYGLGLIRFAPLYVVYTICKYLSNRVPLSPGGAMHLMICHERASSMGRPAV